MGSIERNLNSIKELYGYESEIKHTIYGDIVIIKNVELKEWVASDGTNLVNVYIDLVSNYPISRLDMFGISKDITKGSSRPEAYLSGQNSKISTFTNSFGRLSRHYRAEGNANKQNVLTHFEVFRHEFC